MPTEQIAPKGKYPVVGVDTLAHEDWCEGDFDAKEAAIDHARRRGGTMQKMHVYDDQGHHVFDAGVF